MWEYSVLNVDCAVEHYVEWKLLLWWCNLRLIQCSVTVACCQRAGTVELKTPSFWAIFDRFEC